MDSARLSLFEIYCKVHATVDISELCKKLGMSSEEGEKWIIKLGSDAKIDSEAGIIVMIPPNKSIFADICEKTENLSFRSQYLVNAIQKLSQQSNKQPTTIHANWRREFYLKIKGGLA